MHRNNINQQKPDQFLGKSGLSTPQQSKKRTRKNSLTSWSSRYEELKLYKVRYGNCNVSRHWPQNPSLGQWVQSQRNHYRYWKRGKGKTSMTQERFDALDSLGFKWVFQTHSASKAWSERLEELKNYAKTYGHCDTPHRWPQNPSLGQWVSTQRAEYAKWTQQKPSTMTEDRKNALEAIGFNWCLRKRPARKAYDKQGNQKKQKILSTVTSQKRCTETVPDTITSREPIQCQYQPSITISNIADSRETTAFEGQSDVHLPDELTIIGDVISDSYALTCNAADANFGSESFLPDLRLKNGENSILDISENDKQGLSASPCYLPDMNEEELVFDEELYFDDLSQASFDDDFFQTLEYFL